jgi:hypothetical protein
MLPQAKTRLCDAEWINCVNPMCIFFGLQGEKDTQRIEDHRKAKVRHEKKPRMYAIMRNTRQL